METQCFCFSDGSHKVLAVMPVTKPPLTFTESESGTEGSAGPPGETIQPTIQGSNSCRL